MDIMMPIAQIRISRHEPTSILIDGLTVTFDAGLKVLNLREATESERGYKVSDGWQELLATFPRLKDAQNVALHSEDVGQGQHLLTRSKLLLKRPFKAEEDWLGSTDDAFSMRVPVHETRQLGTELTKFRREFDGQNPTRAPQLTLAASFVLEIKVTDGPAELITSWSDLTTRYDCNISPPNCARCKIIELAGHSRESLQTLIRHIDELFSMRSLSAGKYKTHSSQETIPSRREMRSNCATYACENDTAKLVTFAECGHTICTGCFRKWYTSTRTGRFPITCFHHGCDCKVPVGILQKYLSDAEFLSLARKALEPEVIRPESTWALCLQIDCGRPFLKPSSVDQERKKRRKGRRCEGCLTILCTGCARPWHSGDCGSENIADDANLAGYKIENDARACRVCDTLLEKTGGCNHLICSGCEGHVCWNCIETFPSEAQCTSHLIAVHGSYVGADEDEGVSF